MVSHISWNCIGIQSQVLLDKNTLRWFDEFFFTKFQVDEGNSEEEEAESNDAESVQLEEESRDASAQDEEESRDVSVQEGEESRDVEEVQVSLYIV